MRHRLFYIPFLTLPFILTGYQSDNKPNKLILIPTQTLDLYKILGDKPSTSIQTINSFEISRLVTYKEYKNYLSEIKKDSSEQFYLTQFPDTSIAPKKVYQIYITGTDYDDFPVLGISWDNAMNFCRWKTIKDNPKDSIVFIYRLPNCSEWLAGYSYLNLDNVQNDFNKNYSDWLISTKDESFYSFKDSLSEEFPYDFIYLHKKDDSKALKRKIVIGNSYLYEQEKLLNYLSFSYYSTEGYKQVSFRYVKAAKENSKSILEYWRLNTK